MGAGVIGWRTIHPGINPSVDAAGAGGADTAHMTITDYAIDILLIGLVAFQIHGMRLTRRADRPALVLVGIVAMNYLKTIPTAGNDLLLIVGLMAVGATLGSLAASSHRSARTRPAPPSRRPARGGDPLGARRREPLRLPAVRIARWPSRRLPLQRHTRHHERRRLDRRDDPDGLAEVICRHAIIVFRAHRRFGLTSASLPAIGAREDDD